MIKIAEKSLSKDFSFKTPEESLSFVQKVGKIANKTNHHPEIKLNYNKVKIISTTHDQGKVTKKDHILMEKIDGLNKQAHLQEVYDNAFQRELEKIAKVNPIKPVKTLTAYGTRSAKSRVRSDAQLFSDWKQRRMNTYN